MLTRQQFIDITGEDPVDVLGNDWEYEVDNYMQCNNRYFHNGHPIGDCWYCD